MRQGVGFHLVIRNPHRIVIIESVLIDDVVHYCVKPLDHTIHTQIWIARGNLVKSQIFEIVLKLIFFQNSFGIRIEAFENGYF